jgi:hypothetical protein
MTTPDNSTSEFPGYQLPAPEGTSLRELATEKPAERRTLPGRGCHVLLDDGTEFEVRIDNRDYIAWDKTAPKRKWPSGRDAPFLMTTFLAFCAATRAGLTDLRWEAFEAAAVLVEDVQEEDARPTR